MCNNLSKVILSKMVLKDDLVCDEITKNPYHDRLLIEAFPKLLQESYIEQMQEHPLRAEIIATKLANNIGNDMGFNFVNRMYGVFNPYPLTGRGLEKCRTKWPYRGYALIIRIQDLNLRFHMRK